MPAKYKSDSSTDAGKDIGKLECYYATTYDDKCFWWLLEFQHLYVSEHVLNARNRQPGRLRACGNENLIPAQKIGSSGNCVCILEARTGEENVYSTRSHFGRLRQAAVMNDCTCARNSTAPVNLDIADIDAEFAEAFSERQNFRNPDQGLLGYSPIVKSGTA
jgi:hypothetical protein